MCQKHKLHGIQQRSVWPGPKNGLFLSYAWRFSKIGIGPPKMARVPYAWCPFQGTAAVPRFLGDPQVHSQKQSLIDSGHVCWKSLLIGKATPKGKPKPFLGSFSLRPGTFVSWSVCPCTLAGAADPSQLSPPSQLDTTAKASKAEKVAGKGSASPKTSCRLARIRFRRTNEPRFFQGGRPWLFGETANLPGGTL